jgi:hypothetical protein
MVDCQARDLEVRIRVPIQVQIFLLKFNKIYMNIINIYTFYDAWIIKISL